MSNIKTRVGTPHMKMCSDVHHRVGTPHMKMYSDVLTGVGTPHKFPLMRWDGWVGGWLGGWSVGERGNKANSAQLS